MPNHFSEIAAAGAVGDHGVELFLHGKAERDVLLAEADAVLLVSEILGKLDKFGRSLGGSGCFRGSGGFGGRRSGGRRGGNRRRAAAGEEQAARESASTSARAIAIVCFIIIHSFQKEGGTCPPDGSIISIHRDKTLIEKSSGNQAISGIISRTDEIPLKIK